MDTNKTIMKALRYFRDLAKIRIITIDQTFLP
jgi:hypothetical protein